MKTCATCGETFELRPDKPGFANRCPECTAEEAEAKAAAEGKMDADQRREKSEMDAARRDTIRNMLYTKDS